MVYAKYPYLPPEERRKCAEEQRLAEEQKRARV